MLTLILLTVGGCYEGSGPASTTTNHARKYRLVEDEAFRGEVEQATVLVNSLFDDSVVFTLHPSWKPRPNDKEPVPIYLVEIDPRGRYGISFVPKNDRCIFIDTGLIPDINDLFSNNFKGRTEIATHELLAIVLLHESGHLFQKKSGAFLEGGTGDNFNVLVTKNKELEMEADSFAASLIREGKSPLSKSDRFLAANTLAMALSKVSFNLTGYRVLMRSGESILGTTSLFGDTGYSHPNLILRVLQMNYDLLPIPESKQLLDEFLEKRRHASDVLFGS